MTKTAAVDDLDALRTATREAHEAIQEARQARKELVTALAAAHKEIDDHIASHLGESVREAVALMMEATTKHIAIAEEKIYKRFDSLADALTGSDRASRKAGLPSMEEIVKVMAWVHGG
jgi:hypothetical protein